MAEIASLVGQTAKSANYSVRRLHIDLDPRDLYIIDSLSLLPMFRSGRRSRRLRQEST